MSHAEASGFYRRKAKVVKESESTLNRMLQFKSFKTSFLMQMNINELITAVESELREGGSERWVCSLAETICPPSSLSALGQSPASVSWFSPLPQDSCALAPSCPRALPIGFLLAPPRHLVAPRPPRFPGGMYLHLPFPENSDLALRASSAQHSELPPVSSSEDHQPGFLAGKISSLQGSPLQFTSPFK